MRVDTIKDCDSASSLKSVIAGKTAWAEFRFSVELAGRGLALSYLTDDTTVGEFLEWFHKVEPSFNPDIRRVELRPLSDHDIESLYSAANSYSEGYRWRFGGKTVDPQSFYDSLFANKFCQFAVADRYDGEFYGLVAAYQARLEVGHSQIEFMRCSKRRPAGETVEGMMLFIDHLFKCFPFRKLCMEVPGFNVSELGLEADFLRQEGQLREHHYYGGRYWDHHYYALYRDDWDLLTADYRQWLL